MDIYIADIRNKKDISLRKLSKLTEIPRSTLHDIETGKKSPTLIELEKIAIALEARMTDLFECENK